MAPRYQVRIKDTSGVVQAILVSWVRLEYSKKVNRMGNHTLEINGDLPEVAQFVVDAQIEVWRSDLAASPVIPWTLDYEGFHRTPVEQVDGSWRSRFTSYGRDYKDLLNRRIIAYPANSAQAAKSGVGETVMKAYVDENAGPGATSPPRLLASGVTTGLTVQADLGAGTAWTGARAYRNLIEVLQEIADATGVDFDLVGTGAAAFQFQAQATPLGADRTKTGLDPNTGLNGAGNVPVVFALGFGNMATPLYSLNRTEEINAVYVLGQGIEADREVALRTDAGAIADSPWNRREVSRNANTESATAGLNAVGDGLLEEFAARESFTFDVLQTPPQLYGRDYFVGDTVVANFWGIERNFQIVEATISVQNGIESIQIGVKNTAGR